MLLRRFRNSEPLGFNYHDEGVITDVELYRCAWNAGLRQGARIVEVYFQTSKLFSKDDYKLLVGCWRANLSRAVDLVCFTS